MDENECLICLEDLNSKDIAVLSCKHKMHFKCLTDWINKKNNLSEICPLCNSRGEIINIIDAQSINIIDNQSINNNDNKLKSTTENNQLNPILFNCCCIL